jgi:positive regulator of sigma E activity
MTRRPLQSSSTIYRIPLVIALISAVGLTSALLGDGVWDVLSLLALAVPVALAAMHWRRSRTKA